MGDAGAGFPDDQTERRRGGVKPGPLLTHLRGGEPRRAELGTPLRQPLHLSSATAGAAATPPERRFEKPAAGCSRGRRQPPGRTKSPPQGEGARGPRSRRARAVDAPAPLTFRAGSLPGPEF